MLRNQSLIRQLNMQTNWNIYKRVCCMRYDREYLITLTGVTLPVFKYTCMYFTFGNFYDKWKWMWNILVWEKSGMPCEGFARHQGSRFSLKCPWNWNFARTICNSPDKCETPLIRVQKTCGSKLTNSRLGLQGILEEMFVS